MSAKMVVTTLQCSGPYSGSALSPLHSSSIIKWMESFPNRTTEDSADIVDTDHRQYKITLYAAQSTDSIRGGRVRADFMAESKRGLTLLW